MNYFIKTYFAVKFFVIAFVCLELVLRVGGWVYLRTSRAPDNFIQHSNIPVIMCLGDSFTFGLGADVDESYPAVLSRLLEGRACVINRGRLGANTHVLHSRLPELIKRDWPDVLILLAGLNNGWNSQGLYSFVAGNKSGSNSLYDWFAGLRTVKLIKIAAQRFNAPDADKSKETLSLSSEKDLLNVIKKSPNSALAYRVLSRIYLERYGTEKAVTFLKQSIVQRPHIPELYEYLADIYLETGGREMEAVNVVFDGIFSHPDQRRFYDISLGIFKHITNGQALSFIEERFAKLAGEHELGREFATLFSSAVDAGALASLTGRWILSDIEKIYELCQKNDIKLILQNYPCSGEHENMLREFARERGIAFVNQFKSFSGLEERDDFFVADGHCSARGYERMAQNIAAVMESEGLL